MRKLFKVWCQTCTSSFYEDSIKYFKCVCGEQNQSKLHQVDDKEFIYINKDNFRDILPKNLWNKYIEIVNAKSYPFNIDGVLQYNLNTQELV